MFTQKSRYARTLMQSVLVYSLAVLAYEYATGVFEDVVFTSDKAHKKQSHLRKLIWKSVEVLITAVLTYLQANVVSETRAYQTN